MRYLKRFLAIGQLKFVAMDILGLPFKTRNGNLHVVVNSIRYTKLTRAVCTVRIIDIVVVCIFSDACLIPNGIKSYMLTDHGK